MQNSFSVSVIYFYMTSSKIFEILDL